jgi:hypothetical protein
VAAATALGLLLTWSTGSPFIDIDAWRQEQIEAAERELFTEQESAVAQQVVPTQQASPVPTPTRDSTPGPSQTWTPETPLPTFPPPETTTATPTATSTAIRSPTPTPTPIVAEGDIRSEGGRIETADGRLSIDFPAGATTEDLRVRVASVDVTTVDSIPDHPLVGVWQLEAFAINRDMAEVTQFAESLRVTAKFSVEDIEGLHPDTLRIWAWDEKGGRLAGARQHARPKQQ